ncbi:kinase-like domain-containing protein [Irpex rosettiformis]|uniref:Kinase-like domain-containing protein n=1 Tax=Irpex rosettiformis TaxID=378272 RepID=A0ACB8TSM5_9APHY|nr:kinase-like domain-containing protein [Irpex rosettiformis]
MTTFLELYEPLDVIGNGSFGIIRKVCRKSDGLIFARKELNFERMSERDRKQIVSEVNILKDLHHEHIVRYHDRYVDRDAGILYILMEFCGGGDLSSVIKQAQRHGRPIPEDTVWNYFMQILLALNHCHNPHSTGRLSSGGSGSSEERERRPQILHRDLKPDNVFLSQSNTVKLGDFGLSKALSSSTFFAQTYVGTPYYMSPELMQEKSYDSKSDIWSLGCLIYELCALKPPFHEAKTHAELSVMIRNGRIPPLPKGYSPALGTIIKAMLNLNPAMRPSAQQLLQHERLDLAFKVAETQKMLTVVKTHKATVLAREREVAAREASLLERESQITSLTGLLSDKDAEIASLRGLLSTAESNHQRKVREALLKREDELRGQVLKHEAEVATRMARREEEIMEAVTKREEEIAAMWAGWERETREGMCRAVEERMEWVKTQTEELEREKGEVEAMKEELEERLAKVEEVERRASSRGELGSSTTRSGREKTYQPLDEVKNLMAPLRFSASTSSDFLQQTPIRPSSAKSPPVFETPISRTEAACMPEMPSAMKGVILTSTGESLATPAPAVHAESEFAKLFNETPRVSLNFAKIFDFDSDSEGGSFASEGYETDTRPPSMLSTGSSTDEENDVENTPKQNVTARQTRLRRPSLVRRTSRASLDGPVASTSAGPGPSMSASTSVAAMRKTSARAKAKERERPSRPPSRTAAEYDLSDEENLPSPFLKRVDRNRLTRTASNLNSAVTARPGGGTRTLTTRKSGTLRAQAVVNAASAVATSKSSGTASAVHLNGARSSIARARGASEEARKALSSRP